jgi:hypothetical protein
LLILSNWQFPSVTTDAVATVSGTTHDISPKHCTVLICATISPLTITLTAPLWRMKTAGAGSCWVSRITSVGSCDSTTVAATSANS